MKIVKIIYAKFLKVYYLITDCSIKFFYTILIYTMNLTLDYRKTAAAGYTQSDTNDTTYPLVFGCPSLNDNIMAYALLLDEPATKKQTYYIYVYEYLQIGTYAFKTRIQVREHTGSIDHLYITPVVFVKDSMIFYFDPFTNEILIYREFQLVETITLPFTYTIDSFTLNDTFELFVSKNVDKYNIYFLNKNFLKYCLNIFIKPKTRIISILNIT